MATCLVFNSSRFLFQGFMIHIYLVMYFTTCSTGISINNRANNLESWQKVLLVHIPRFTTVLTFIYF